MNDAALTRRTALSLPLASLGVALLGGELGPDRKIAEFWSGTALAGLPKAAFHNEFDYQKFHAGRFGIVGPVGAMATIALPGEPSGAAPAPGTYTLKLYSINDHMWSLPVSLQRRPDAQREASP